MDIRVLFLCTILTVAMGKSAAQTAVASSLEDLQALSSCLTVNGLSFIYLLFDVQLRFDDAKSFCASLVNLDDAALNTGLTDPHFFLARVSSIAERTQLLNLLNVQVPRVGDRNDFWIGLQDENGIGGSDPSIRFLRWVDGSTEGLDTTFIGVLNGAFPWDQGEPDDSNSVKNCVRWDENTNLLDDRSCSETNAVLCRVDCDPNAFQPTTAPTQSPAIGTGAPTQSPTTGTGAPTQSPTTDTGAPTQSPALDVHAPTDSPAAGVEFPTQSPLIVTSAPSSSPLAAGQATGLTANQIIAGASLLSVVVLLLILGIIYGIRSVIKEKRGLDETALQLPPSLIFREIHELEEERSDSTKWLDARDSYSTAFPKSPASKSKSPIEQ